MGLTYEQAKALGIGELHPDHPGGPQRATSPPTLVRGRPLVEILQEHSEPATARPNKYRAVPTQYGGVRYDSKAEAERAAQLDLMVRAGEVKFWVRQVTFR